VYTPPISDNIQIPKANFGDKANRDWVGLQVNGGGLLTNQPYAQKLWNYSTSFLKRIESEPDSVFYKSIKEIKNTEVHNYLQSRAISMHKSDLRGIAFSANSDISKKIVDSKDFSNFINNGDILQKLLKREHIKDAAVQFKEINSPDLYHSIKNANVINPYLDQNGSFHAIIADIYDFSSNSTGIAYDAYLVQKAGLLENYFILIFIDLDKSEIIKMLNNPNYG
jgi:hypothetical protein